VYSHAMLYVEMSTCWHLTFYLYIERRQMALHFIAVLVFHFVVVLISDIIWVVLRNSAFFFIKWCVLWCYMMCLWCYMMCFMMLYDVFYDAIIFYDVVWCFCDVFMMCLWCYMMEYDRYMIVFTGLFIIIHLFSTAYSLLKHHENPLENAPHSEKRR